MRLASLSIAAAALALAACASMPSSPVSVADTAARTPTLSTLNRLIGQAGLADTLRGAGPFTVFAPSDDAFKALPEKTLQDLARNPELLRSVLTFHVVPGKMPSTEVRNGPAKSVQGAPLALSRAGSFVTVEDAVVVQADVAASNGVVHVIDRVLMPPRR